MQQSNQLRVLIGVAAVGLAVVAGSSCGSRGTPRSFLQGNKPGCDDARLTEAKSPADVDAACRYPEELTTSWTCDTPLPATADIEVLRRLHQACGLAPLGSQEAFATGGGDPLRAAAVFSWMKGLGLENAEKAGRILTGVPPFEGEIILPPMPGAPARALTRTQTIAKEPQGSGEWGQYPGWRLSSLTGSPAIAVSEPEKYVSRGGLKLEAALDAFGLDVAGFRCLDIGASTGGFSDCLLQRGAASVLAVDVGRAQLHQKLREDDRVTLLEGVNARSLPELSPVDFFVADVSFISLRKVLPSVAERIKPDTPGVVLLKPQFEAGPRDVPRGGVIRDESIRERVLREFHAWGEVARWQIHRAVDCPLSGARGNVEFLVSLSAPKSEAGIA